MEFLLPKGRKNSLTFGSHDGVEVSVIHNTKENNDYSLWLAISEKNDCYLLDENLATMRTPYGFLWMKYVKRV